MSDKAKAAVALILDINPEASYRNIAQLLNRREESIHRYVAASRDMLRYSAPIYVEEHLRATRIAALDGNAAPAQWALERIDAQTEDGTTIRVVEAPAQRYDTGRLGEGGVVVNVGLAISQVAPTPPPAPRKAVEEFRTLPSFPVEQSSIPLNLGSVALNAMTDD